MKVWSSNPRKETARHEYFFSWSHGEIYVGGRKVAARGGLLCCSPERKAMSKDFLLRELDNARKETRRRQLKWGALIFLFVPVLLFVLIKPSSKPNSLIKSIEKPSSSVGITDKEATKPQQNTVQSANPPIATPAPTVTPPTSNQAAREASDQKYCADGIKNFDAGYKALNTQYYDSWKKWLDTYAGQKDTKAAIDDKEWFKDYFHKRYQDLISRNDSTLQKLCHYDPGLTARAPEPDYNAWQ